MASHSSNAPFPLSIFFGFGKAGAMPGSFNYVYLLRSKSHPDQTYIGITSDLRKRLADHNAGKAKHTSKFRPWTLETYVAFSDVAKARAFEKYLKSSSGSAFANKRLR